MAATSKKCRLGFESLEDRSLLSSYINPSGDLVITGGTGNDTVNVNQLGAYTVAYENGLATYYLTSNIWSGKVVYYGGQGNDTFTDNANLRVLAWGGQGNDRVVGGNLSDDLYGDGPNYYLDTSTYAGGHDTLVGRGAIDRLYGGDGDDTLVTIDGGSADSADGQGGWDTAWGDQTTGTLFNLDFNYAEKVYNIAGFANGADRTLDGDRLADPAVKATDSNGNPTGHVYRTFSGNPLFGGGGPTYTDIRQGQVGDCWMLSKLGAVANDAPGSARSLVADFGDGTYGVKLGNNFYRVDNDLPVLGPGSTTLAYAGLGAGNGMWVAVIEKAYAQFRTANGVSNGYRALDGGWVDEAARAFGCAAPGFRSFGSYGSAASLASNIAALWEDYQQVTVSWGDQDGNPNTKYLLGGRLIDAHAYTVAWINYNASGGVDSIALRNPWGIDSDVWWGVVDGANDGFLTVTPAELYSIGGWVDWGRV